MTSKIDATEWTTIVMDAIAQAERFPNKEVIIHVGTDEAYHIIDEACLLYTSPSPRARG